MKSLFLICLAMAQHSNAQYRNNLSSKVSIEVNTNLESYFFAEKLAVEKIKCCIYIPSRQKLSMNRSGNLKIIVAI